MDSATRAAHMPNLDSSELLDQSTDVREVIIGAFGIELRSRYPEDPSDTRSWSNPNISPDFVS